jgi:hypothetical protein
MRLVALVQEPENIARYLRHLGLTTEVPALAAARGPPFWQSRILRSLRGLGPARPAPAPRGFAAPVAAATECRPTRLKRSRSSPSPLRPSLAYPSARHWTGTRLPRDAKFVPMAVDGQCFPPGSARSAAPPGIDRQLPSTPDTPRGRLFRLRTRTGRGHRYGSGASGSASTTGGRPDPHHRIAHLVV